MRKISQALGYLSCCMLLSTLQYMRQPAANNLLAYVCSSMVRNPGHMDWMFVYPQILMLKPQVPNVVIFGHGTYDRELGLDEFIWVGLSSDGISALVRRDNREFILSFSLHHVRKQWTSGHLQARRRSLTSSSPCWHSDLRLPASRSLRSKFLLFEPFRLWYFAMAAQDY